MEQDTGKKIEWLTDFKGCHECQEFHQGFRGVAESIVYALLVLCVLGAVYACFEKIEPEPPVKQPTKVEGLHL